MARRMLVAGLTVWGATVLPGVAQETVSAETFQAGGATITVHLHPFLTEEEAAVLRQIAASPEALAALLGEKGGYAAIAVSPEEGFIREGLPVGSAVALAELPDAATARAEAVAACESASSSGAECVPVVEVAPSS